MQCDAHCSEYKPCISTCAIETCDNILNSANRLCSEDSCVEGCAYKPCPEEHIYRNTSYLECVPKSICRPVCMSLNGIDYYEGDEIHGDNCQTCHCTKGKKICIGAPCTASSTIPYHVQPVIVNQGDASVSCKYGWSEWINQEILDDGDKQKDNTKIGDHEPLPNSFMLKNYKNSAFCDADYMTKIECRSVDTHQHPKTIDEDVECSLEKGLICRGQCHDYEIRVYCDCNESIEILMLPTIGRTTHLPGEADEIRSKIVQQTVTESTKIISAENKYNSICDPTIPYVKKPGDCHKFYHCTMNASGVWIYVEETCGNDMMFDPQAKVCDYIANVKKINHQCAGGPKIVETSIQITYEHSCPVGKVWSECAIPCGRSCHFYNNFLLKIGLCSSNHNYCEPGCVDQSILTIDCPSGQLWRDDKTCVRPSDCNCQSEEGNIVKVKFYTQVTQMQKVISDHICIINPN